jgi:TorA maturation chaperone TorD
MSEAGELPPEEQARANFYSLLARMFYAPPDRALLAALAGSEAPPSEGKDDALGSAWAALAEASAVADEAAVRDEYEGVFIGTGKAPVTLYTSAYTVKTAVDNPLVDIREFLLRHGLGRQAEVQEPEDHVAAVCEVMRILVAEQQASLEEQSGFFKSFVAPGGLALCDAIDAHPGTWFYKHVAKLARAFFQLEHATLDMH